MVVPMGEALHNTGCHRPVLRLHIVGSKNHGKTTLIEQLVPALKARGWRVGTVKHTHHRHELDVPGKDSHRHRMAGAEPVAVLSRDLVAVYIPRGRDSSQEPYDFLERWFDACHIVLVEGDMQARGAKIEVWRAQLGTPPRAIEDPSILAVVTDDPVCVQVPVLPRHNLAPLVSWIEQLLHDSRANSQPEPPSGSSLPPGN
ncbi:MAG: hypothetical protein KatS3mg110_3673 [Pirellulaceae bacterium]|nr:MAG: hypothetical protein KatS3mg110_3673 [Pirellulaceae bacterium]